MGCCGCPSCLIESICRFVGQTVTIFTASGGVSGCGFTGVLLGVDNECVKLLCDIGAGPACAVGSPCCGNLRDNPGFFGNPLGALSVIPCDAIVCFVHNAI